MKNNEQIKDKYGQYSEKNEFSEYWDNFHRLESLSMKESIYQKKLELRS